MDKREVRSSYLQKREEISLEDSRVLSLKIQESFVLTPEFLSAESIALYSGFRGEVWTDLIAERAGLAGKHLAFPKVMGHNPPHLAFFWVGGYDELVAGAYGIMEPSPRAQQVGEADIKGFDCIVVPGVAFDLFGFRLGYGKGFYDRQLSRVSASIVALSYDWQVREEALPVESHDVKMDVLVTDKEVLRF